jgi:O-acetyl-ADP-ribose deacetylase (regulator of RNase III)
MREIAADAWSVECDVLCITTNCTLRRTGSLKLGPAANVMGGGIAGEAARRDPSLPVRYAKLIQWSGHHVYPMILEDSTNSQDVVPRPVLMFPTKDEVWENSYLSRIHQSCIEAAMLSNIYGWETIALPRPGAGLGGLDWHSTVKPYLEGLLDDRFLIVSFPGEK